MNKKHYFYGVCEADARAQTHEFWAAKRRGLLAGIVVLFLAAVFAGCDNDGDDSGGDDSNSGVTITGATIYPKLPKN
jgi:hypothetical protein